MKKNLRSMIESWQESPAQILVDMNQYDLIESTGMKPDLAHKKSAHMSAAWRLCELDRVVIPMGGSDLSGVRYLTFSVCSAGAAGASFRLVFSNSQTGENIGGYETTVTVAKDGASYDFCVERYLTGPETEVYTAVGALEAGTVVDIEGFLYWYDAVNTHITAITVVE